MYEKDNKYEIQMMRVIFICFTHKVQFKKKLEWIEIISIWWIKFSILFDCNSFLLWLLNFVRVPYIVYYSFLQMMFDMTMGIDPMMKMRQWNMSLDNVSSSIIHMMAKETKMYMDAMMKDGMSSEEKMIAFDMHILELMTRGIKSHQDKYLKVKTMQCAGAMQAFTCVVNELQRSTGLHSDAVGFIASVGSNLYVVVSDMCTKERVCDLVQGE